MWYNRGSLLSHCCIDIISCVKAVIMSTIIFWGINHPITKTISLKIKMFSVWRLNNGFITKSIFYKKKNQIMSTIYIHTARPKSGSSDFWFLNVVHTDSNKRVTEESRWGWPCLTLQKSQVWYSSILQIEEISWLLWRVRADPAAFYITWPCY